MFEFLFKYPPAVFAKGSFVLLGRWPAWVLGMAILAAVGLLGWTIWRRRQRMAPGLFGLRPPAIWMFQTALIALILFLLWRPALSVATLRPQQNIIAVLVDDSASMGIREDGKARIEQAVATLNSGLLADLRKNFQVRLYKFGGNLERIEKPDHLAGKESASRIGDALKDVVADANTLPVGAVVLLSDGADNSGGIDLETVRDIRRHHIPIHVIGFGHDHAAHDVEILDVAAPQRALPESRLSAEVTLRQYGYAGHKARLAVRDGSRVLAGQEVTLKGDGIAQTERLLFDAGSSGAKNLRVSVDPLDGEENANNNSAAFLVNVQARKPRILYFEGEPRWEFKFIRRAVEDDHSLQLVTILRPTQNKIYRQGISNPKELESGFPVKPEELFAFDGLILGSTEAAYFDETQQAAIKEFVDRRGGGLLFLAGRFALAEGGWGKAPFADLLPVTLPSRTGTFHRDPTGVELTMAGRDSLICRLDEKPEANAELWKKLPALANYQEIGTPKPGAVTLAEMTPAGHGRLPLLVTENYGRGRSAVFATAGSWRWKMLREHTDQTHATFWRQFLRWLVSDTPGHVSASTRKPVLSDEGRVVLRAEVRDKTFQAASDARVEARILGPAGLTETVDLALRPGEPGVYSGEWNAPNPGSYAAEITARRGDEEIGRDSVMFRREDGVAENFRTGQNRELLQKLATETGGDYYTPVQARKLAKQISYSEAGISVRETRDLWDMPAVFLLALLLLASEWLLRRKWGIV
jgi:uncharacterized membrane protein